MASDNDEKGKLRKSPLSSDIGPSFTIASVFRAFEEQSRVIRMIAAGSDSVSNAASVLREALSYSSTSAIADFIKAQDLAKSAMAGQLSDLQRSMRIINIPVNVHERQFTQIAKSLEAIRFTVPALTDLGSPFAAITASTQLMLKAFDGFRQDVEVLKAIALRPTWELQQLTETVAKSMAETDKVHTLIATRTIEAATIETAQVSEVVREVLRRQASWVVPEPPPASLPIFNLFRIQEREIQQLANSPLADRINIEALPSSLTAALARYMCHLIIEVNHFAISDNQEPIFYPTNRLVEGAASIGFIVATSRPEFEDLVNLLFQMLYEASGASNRLKPILTDEELAPIWMLKQLRLSAFHDVEHGEDREVAGKQKKIAEAYRGLLGKPIAESEEDYRTLQVRLLKRLVEMLELTRSKLGGKKISGPQ